MGYLRAKWWVTTTFLVVSLWPAYLRSESSRGNSTGLFCRGGSCAERLSTVVDETSPALIIDTARVVARLKAELYEAGDWDSAALLEADFIELEKAVLACEELELKLSPAKYGSFEELLNVCSEPAVIKERKRYDGVAIPLTGKISRRWKALKAFEKGVAENFVNFLLAKKAMLEIEFAGARGQSEVTAELGPPESECKNAKKGKFKYPIEGQQESFEIFKDAVNGYELQNFVRGTSQEHIERIQGHLGKIDSMIGRICGKWMSGELARYITDPRAMLVYFNSEGLRSGVSELTDKVTFCRYVKDRNWQQDLISDWQYLFDGTAFVLGMLPGPGMVASSVSNVGFYGYKTGESMAVAQEYEDRFLAGVADPDKTVEVQNESAEVQIEATFVGVGEALGWALPVVGKVVGKRIINWLRAGKLPNLIRNGTIRLVGTSLEISGKKYSLKDLPSGLVSRLRKAFAYLGKQTLAKKAKIHLGALVSLTSEIGRKYGSAAARKFEEILEKKGRKYFDKMPCNGFLVVGSSAFYVATRSSSIDLKFVEVAYAKDRSCKNVGDVADEVMQRPALTGSLRDLRRLAFRESKTLPRIFDRSNEVRILIVQGSHTTPVKYPPTKDLVNFLDPYGQTLKPPLSDRRISIEYVVGKKVASKDEFFTAVSDAGKEADVVYFAGHANPSNFKVNDDVILSPEDFSSFDFSGKGVVVDGCMSGCATRTAETIGKTGSPLEGSKIPPDRRILENLMDGTGADFAIGTRTTTVTGESRLFEELFLEGGGQRVSNLGPEDISRPLADPWNGVVDTRDPEDPRLLYRVLVRTPARE